jgi:hypothetical protein
LNAYVDTATLAVLPEVRAGFGTGLRQKRQKSDIKKVGDFSYSLCNAKVTILGVLVRKS